MLFRGRPMLAKAELSLRSPVFLRLALGLVYFHFGLLKFFPDLSPAELIGTQTVMSVSLHWLDAHAALIALAILETAIGLSLIFNLLPRITFMLFVLHMVGTFMPLFVLPEFTFKIAPFAPNMEGQYIFKNIVFLAAGWTVLYPHVFARASAGEEDERESSTAATPQVAAQTAAV
ncbi:MAG: DoxX family membrane protein [Planctomycetota bacterium]|nr:MAG: DoxX family membrane protein [Planctomycetota bacterium]